MKVFIVIPTYNNTDKIGEVITDLINHGYGENIVVVDDGSCDNVMKVLRSFPQVKLLRHIINRGQGAALETGNKYALQAGAEVIVHFDADGQMQAGDIVKLIAPLQEKKYEVVLGSRYLGNLQAVPWLKRYIYFPVGRLVNLIFTGLWLTDAHCGFRALSREAARKIDIRQDRMAHATEILEKLSRLHLKYIEVPVNIKYHKFGQGLGGANGALRTVKDLFKAKFFK